MLHSTICIHNDICDREFDAKVERTKDCPLVTSAVSVVGASVLMLLLLIGIGCLLLFTNQTVTFIVLVGALPLHAVYPLTKRWTYWPQAWLGFAMTWGFPVAWAHVTGESDVLIASVAMAGTVCWTIVYDTMYACQDLGDDIKAGIRSTAILFGCWVRPILTIFAATFVVCLAYAGYLNGQGPAYFCISCGGAAFHFLLQFITWDVNNPRDGGVGFIANRNLGYIITSGMLLDYILEITTF